MPSDRPADFVESEKGNGRARALSVRNATVLYSKGPASQIPPGKSRTVLTLDNIHRLRRQCLLNRRFNFRGGKVPDRHIELGQEKPVPLFQCIVGMIDKQDPRDNQKTHVGMQLVLAFFTTVLQRGNERRCGKCSTKVSACARFTFSQCRGGCRRIATLDLIAAIEGLFAQSFQSVPEGRRMQTKCTAKNNPSRRFA